jgi:CARDB protein
MGPSIHFEIPRYLALDEVAKLTRKLLLLWIVFLAHGLTPLLAEDEEPAPQPDLWAAEIVAPEGGLVFGPNNQIKVIVQNLIKDSEVEGPVKIELVVIQADSGERASYFAEVDGMREGQKREALFSGVAVTNQDSVKLLAIVDPEKLIEEANEVNNRRLYQVWLKQAPAPSPTPPAEDEPEPATPEDS